MARRRKITAPSAEDLASLEAGFQRDALTPPETSLGASQGTPKGSVLGAPLGAGMAPITQVAAQTAQAIDPRPAEVRAAQEADKKDAETLRTALSEGRLITPIALEQIADDAMIRDRTILVSEEMEELKSSIAISGLRLPIEVYNLPHPQPDGPQYGLLSGYRRLRAYRELLALSGAETYHTIPAIVRDPDAMGGAFAAMVAENEIRSNLSHFERGRIAAVAAQQGAFANTDAAVGHLFKVASKAKRSKIRSFAVIFEELGDVLEFPESLKEKEGLRLASALRNGGEPALRRALSAGVPATPDDEWAAILPILTEVEHAVVADPRRGGRPKAATKRPGWQGQTRVLSNGITLQRSQDNTGHVIRLEGPGVTPDLVEAAIERLAYLFEASD